MALSFGRCNDCREYMYLEDDGRCISCLDDESESTDDGEDTSLSEKQKQALKRAQVDPREMIVTLSESPTHTSRSKGSSARDWPVEKHIENRDDGWLI